MDSFTITVTQKHLDKAIEVMNRNADADICNRCVVAQALMEVPDLGFEAIGFDMMQSKAGEFYCPQAATITHKAYNSTMRDDPESIAALLPITLTWERI